MENNLNNIITNPTIRKYVYNAIFLIVFALGAIGVGFGAAETVPPLWYVVAVAVTGFVSGATNGMAGANTPKKEVEPDTAETIAKKIENS